MAKKTDPKDAQKRDETASPPKKVIGRPFQPGNNANPGGRPAIAKNIQELARAYTEPALRALGEALKDKRTKVSAAVALLDRGFGRPIQTHNVRQIRDWADLTDEELAVLASQDETKTEKGTRH